MDLYDRKMVTNTNLKYADSSLNYYVIIMVQNFKLENFKKKKSYSRSMKCQPKANNNREAVVVCARYVVKRPSKRMRASIYGKRTIRRKNKLCICHIKIMSMIVKSKLSIIPSRSLAFSPD